MTRLETFAKLRAPLVDLNHRAETVAMAILGFYWQIFAR